MSWIKFLLKIIKEIESFIKKYDIEIVFTHDFYDLNNDHKIINKAVVTAARPFMKRLSYLAVRFFLHQK